MSIYISPVPGDEAQRDTAAGREWAESIYRKRRADDVRNEFDAKDLFDCLGDDEDRLMALCVALLPCIYSNSGDSVTEAVQAIVNPEIERRAAA